jgi:hypothetical protein
MSTGPILVTVDTNLLDTGSIEGLRGAAHGESIEFATVTVNERERGAFDVDLRALPETALWGESRWDEAVWGGPLPESLVLDETPLDSGSLAGEADVRIFERVLSIVSSGSFPKVGARETLTNPQHRQLRDAMAFEAHLRQKRHVFLSDDKKAFVSHGKREALQALGNTFILTSAEFIELGPGGLRALTS